MYLTLRRIASLCAATGLTVISAIGVNAAHSRSQKKSTSHPHKPSSSKPAPGSTSKASQKPSNTDSTAARRLTAIDRASHGREMPGTDWSTSSAARGENIARTALAYRGVPYRFGGRSAKSGFDCSGLVQAVCAKWGLYLPRVAGAQFGHGTPVKPDALRPGDLVFFQGTYKRGLSHVGIFIGEGQFVHAAGAGKGVMISSLSDPYHLKHWAGARRFDLKQLPKTIDELPILASEVIVERPSAWLEPHGRIPSTSTVGDAKPRPAERAGASEPQPRESDVRESTPRLRL